MRDKQDRSGRTRSYKKSVGDDDRTEPRRKENPNLILDIIPESRLRAVSHE